jgi:phosphatidate cytidylyltransferase
VAFAQLKSRVLVAVVAGPLVVLAMYVGRVWMLFLVMGIALLSQWEFYQLCRKKGGLPAAALSYIATAALILDMYVYQFSHAVEIFAVYLVLLGIFNLWRFEGAPLFNISASVLGVALMGILLSYFLGLRELPRELGFDYSRGAYWTLTVVFTFWVGDTVAYFVGSSLGRRKLASKISPKKTVEGAVAGFISMVLFVVLVGASFIPEWHIRDLLIVGTLCGTVGQMSDLVESMFKRDAGVKDTSSILPGHGGIFDRFDVLFLTSPAVYLYLKYLSAMAAP